MAGTRLCRREPSHGSIGPSMRFGWLLKDLMHANSLRYINAWCVDTCNLQHIYVDLVEHCLLTSLAKGLSLQERVEQPRPADLEHWQEV
jgi:hypothetical protein